MASERFFVDTASWKLSSRQQPLEGREVGSFEHF